MSTNIFVLFISCLNLYTITEMHNVTLSLSSSLKILPSVVNVLQTKQF